MAEDFPIDTEGNETQIPEDQLELLPVQWEPLRRKWVISEEEGYLD